MQMQEVKDLMAYFEKSGLKKIQYKKGDFELLLEKEGQFAPTSVHVQTAMPEVKKAPPKNEGKFIKSPMVGTFYLTPAPDHPPFVKVGDKVSEGTVVCVIEAMKVMNEVKAGCKGTVVEVLCENGHPVEFGTKLFRIE